MKTNKQLFGNLTQAWRRQAKVLLGIIALIAVIVFAFAGCDDGNGNDNGNGGNSASDVYLAGAYRDAATDTYTPCYWKNGAKTNLPVPAGAEGYISSEGNCIAVSPNGDVYILGSYSIGNYRDPDYSETYCYWKNGVRTDLNLSVPAGAKDDWLVGMAVSSKGDIYIAGTYGIGEWGDDTYTYMSCYWKNGVRTDLSVPGADSFIEARDFIAVSPNGDVYVISWIDDDDTEHAGYYCYWKNGVRTDASSDVWLGGIAISANGDVYILGSYWLPDGVDEWGDPDYTETSCYWKNGVRTDLNLSVPAGAEIDLLSGSIAVSAKGDVYILGFYETEDDYILCYWKNGVRIDLSLPAGAICSEYTSDIAVSANGDVYVLGEYKIGEWGDPDYTVVSCYWKNGARTDLPEGSYAYAIAAR